MTALRRCGDFPELFWDADPTTPLELICCRPRGAAPEHLRIRWRPAAAPAEAASHGSDSGRGE